MEGDGVGDGKGNVGFTQDDLSPTDSIVMDDDRPKFVSGLMLRTKILEQLLSVAKDASAGSELCIPETVGVCISELIALVPVNPRSSPKTRRRTESFRSSRRRRRSKLKSSRSGRRRRRCGS